MRVTRSLETQRGLSLITCCSIDARAVLIGALLLVLLGCGSRRSASNVGDVSVLEISNDRIYYTISRGKTGAVLRSRMLGASHHDMDIPIDAELVMVVRVREGWIASVRDRTPAGKATFQPYRIDIESGRLVPLFEPSESFRHPIVAYQGELHFNKSNKYVGVMGGEPWAFPAEVCKLESSSGESVIAGLPGSLPPSALIGRSPYLPVREIVGTKHRIRLVNVEGKSVYDLGLLAYPMHLAVTNDGQRVGIVTALTDPVVKELSSVDAKQLSAVTVSGRCVGLLYDDRDVLHVVTQENGRPANVWRIEAGKVGLLTVLQ